MISTAFGVLIVQLGLPGWVGLGLSLFVYSGALQFLAAQFFATGDNIWNLYLVAVLMNMRHVVYTAFLRKDLQSLGRLRFIAAGFLTDEAFGAINSESELSPHAMMPLKITIYLSWVTGTALGLALGHLLPKIEGLDFVLTALFAVMALESAKCLSDRRQVFLSLGLGLCAPLALSFFIPNYYLFVTMVSAFAYFMVFFKPEAPR